MPISEFSNIFIYLDDITEAANAIFKDD